MIEDIYILQYVAIIFGSVVLFLWILLGAFEKPPRSNKRKSAIFSCGTGMKAGELNVSHGNYYKYMKRFLGAGYLARLHSGRLSDYVIWIIAGTAAVMAAMVILW